MASSDFKIRKLLAAKEWRILIEIGGSALIVAGAPEILVGAGVFLLCIGAGVIIDKGSGAIKDKYYGRW